jgi:hypothetical protein
LWKIVVPKVLADWEFRVVVDACFDWWFNWLDTGLDIKSVTKSTMPVAIWLLSDCWKHVD